MSPGDIAFPIRSVFRKKNNVEVLLEDALSINKEMKRVYVKIGNIEDFIQYDYLIITVGTEHSYFGHNDWERFAPGLKMLSDALLIREKIFNSLEMAEKLHRKSKSRCSHKRI